MSHIPNKAVPHAKAEPEQPARKPSSGLLIGGAIAAGIALVAAPLLAWTRKPAKKSPAKAKPKPRAKAKKPD